MRALCSVAAVTSASVLLTAAAVALAGTGAAGTESFIKGDFKPGTVPENNFDDGKLSIELRLYNSDHIDVNAAPDYELEQLAIDLDGDIKLRPNGINRCDEDLSESTTDEALALCGPSGDDARVGSGESILTLNYGDPGNPTMFDFAPILYEVTAFNGPMQNGHSTVLLHLGEVSAGDLDETYVITAEIIGSPAASDYGKRLFVADLPTLSTEPSSGSADAGIVNLKWSMKRGDYTSARCRDTNRDWNIRADFTYYDGSVNSDKHDFACKRD